MPGEEVLGEGLGALQARGRRLGPKQGRPAAWNASTMPATSGPSGPTIVRPTPSRRASSTSAGMFVGGDGDVAHFGSAAVPALPGATSTSLDARRCGAFPGERVFASAAADDQDLHAVVSVAEVAHAGEHHRHAVLVGGGDHLGVAHASRPAGSPRLMPCSARHVEAVAEREERVRGHHRALRPRAARRRPSCAAMRVEYDAAHLAGADADRAALRAHTRWRST